MRSFGLTDYQVLVKKNLQAFNQIDLPKEDGYLARFAVFSANLTNFLPHIPVTSHADLFRQNLSHVALETLDRGIPHLSDLIAFEGHTDLVAIDKKQFIFSTFHLGSYRSLAAWLVRLGYDFSILVRQSVYDQQSAEILAHAQLIKSVYPSAADVQVINAEEPTAVLKILRQLRTGRSLVVYMDGNTGAGDDKGERIDFLQRQIFAKQGAAFLSHASAVPILPVVCYRQPDFSNVLMADQPIFPDKELPKNIFSFQTTQRLYDWFSDYLKQYPEQWEAWSYIHHQLFLPPTSSSSPPLSAFQKTHYRFNQERYSLFALQNEFVLFDRFYYQTYEITFDLYEYLLQNLLKNPQKTLGKPLFEDLMNQSVLI